MVEDGGVKMDIGIMIVDTVIMIVNTGLMMVDTVLMIVDTACMTVDTASMIVNTVCMTVNTASMIVNTPPLFLGWNFFTQRAQRFFRRGRKGFCHFFALPKKVTKKV